MRYKQTVIGAAWALIRPFLTMVVFTVVFGKLAKLPSDGAAPYALMVFAGMLPWSFFATALGDASNSLIGNANLISKVYFPRLIVPIAAVMVAFVDFLISFAILVGLMIWYQFVPGWQILLLPVFAAIAFMASLGIGVVDHGAQRQISRFPLRHSVHCAAGPLCVSGWIQLEHHPGSVAAGLFPQSTGRRDRRVSLVPARRRKPALFAGPRAQPRRHRLFPVAWHSPVQEDGKELCRSDLIGAI